MAVCLVTQNDTLTPRMRNVVKAKYDVGAVRLRREIVREQRVPVVDDENDRTLHLVRPQ